MTNQTQDKLDELVEILKQRRDELHGTGPELGCGLQIALAEEMGAHGR